jgi:membrane-bound lytic murein transglycosylase D
MVQVPAGVDLAAVASTANTSVKQLRTLNNELLKNQTPPTGKHYALRVPLGCKEMVAANIDQLRRRPARTNNIAYATHVVKKGDTLTAISKRYQVSMTDLLKSNNLRVAQLKTGQRLQIPIAASNTLIAGTAKQAEKQVARSTNQGSKQTYRVQKGDTLDRIARRHGVSIAQLKKWNAIKDNRSLLAGQKLTLHTGASAAVPSSISTTISLTSTAKETVQTARHSTPAPAKQKETAAAVALTAKVTNKSPGATTAAATAKPAVVAKQNAKKAPASQSWYVVQHGDTMWTIAKKFSISVDNIRQWNNLSSNTIRTGNRLLIRKG